MHEHVLVGLTVVVALGVAAQWLAWRFRLPSILLLLAFGFVAGPVGRWATASGPLAGWSAYALDPDALFGDLFLPLVSLSVAVILYEGGLSLSVRDLPKVGNVVWRLVTVGAGVTWLLSAWAAHAILGLSWNLALLLGAVLVVTGPTVIIPMLRHVRPTGPVGPITKWEGIVIDPIGAALAVLVYEVAFAAAPGEGFSTAALGVLRTVGVGGGLGIAAGLLLTYLVRAHAVPEFLHNAVSLMLVTAVFTASNHVQSESGLFAVTTMGVLLANQRFASVRHIIDFKENLRALLLAFLFIALAARLNFADLRQLAAASGVFVALLILLIRPAAVLASTSGTQLRWAERGFLAWMAPRGIVAAAVSSVFALRLEPDVPEARVLVPLTFLVIIATVAVYGLTASPLARLLQLSDQRPQGLLLVGAHAWARALAEVLKREDVRVLLVDRNRANIRQARLAGLPAYEGNILGEYVLDELDLRGIGRLLAVTPNDEVNALAAQRFARVFGAAKMYQLAPLTERRGEKAVPSELHARLLFDGRLTYADISERFFARGNVFRATPITEEFNLGALRGRYGDSFVPMFILRAGGDVVVVTGQQEAKPRPGDTLISLAPREDKASAAQAKKKQRDQERQERAEKRATPADQAADGEATDDAPAESPAPR